MQYLIFVAAFVIVRARHFALDLRFFTLICKNIYIRISFKVRTIISDFKAQTIYAIVLILVYAQTCNQ